ncbi:zinc finger protein [Macleaya cordata]|uniref:Zinc finger protein n=1 Tax=Macleaya cordata TaxID=56857 RepID=A0A200R2P3_MACCD|nr:zinc finger protein [Macleaya cordata]
MSSSSSAAAAAATTTTAIPPIGGGNSSGYFLQNLSNLGLGYAIAIALGFLVLLSTVLLASYVCCRARNRSRSENPNPNPSNSNNGIILPRIIFVAEDDEDENGRDEENVVTGLDQMVINSYPKFPFCNSKDLGTGDSVCSICLCDYKEGEMLRMMPDCRHFFHLCCVDAWLRLNASCPVCRNSPLPTPLSTPLSELVPLSHYPGNRRR